ncbi:MAG TPA: hypothetical protein VGE66_15350 [Chitinophagaceae bacterium]
MLFDKAQQIKAQLRYFEGRTIDSRTIWKVMLCPRSHPPGPLVEQCRHDFAYDEVFCALNYRDNIDVYIVYRNNDSFFWERHDEFAGKRST